jgi:hypothetical protein
MNLPAIHCLFDRLADPSTLKPHPKNPNRHSAAQVAAIAAVIQGNGWRAPITVSSRSGLIVRGHGRLEAALLMGLTEVPVDEQDYATEADELADMVADNHLSELAEADKGQLVAVLKELQAVGHDIGLAGFSEDEFAALTSVEEAVEDLPQVPAMEIQAFEHHDYLVFMFRDIRDWLRVIQLMGVAKVNYSISRKTAKIGIGRVIDGKRLLGRLENPAGDHVPGPGGPHDDAQPRPAGDAGRPGRPGRRVRRGVPNGTGDDPAR